jgi:hypothetical protein
MITDWVFHPFRHLEGGHSMMHGTTAAPGAGAESSPTIRRLIFLRVLSSEATDSLASLFRINATRTAQFFADVDLHELVLLRVKDVGAGTGWGLVPTPMF